jgi:transposase
MPKSRMYARTDNRKIMNAILYALRTGMPWRDLPERYGPYTTAYNRFNRWSRRGIWKRIAHQIVLTLPQRKMSLLTDAVEKGKNGPIEIFTYAPVESGFS